MIALGHCLRAVGLPKKRNTRNKFETRLQKQLKRAKVSFKYESEKLEYVLIRKYIPDFILEGNGKKIYIEAKGYLRPEHKPKMVAVKKAFPEIDLRIVFYSSKPKDIRWAVKNKFPYAIGTIPKEWLDEVKSSSREPAKQASMEEVNARLP